MAQKKETAEQKLLKMIESSSSVAESASAQKKVTKQQSSLGALQALNKALVLVFLLSIGFFVWEVQNGLAMVGKDSQFSSTAASLPEGFSTEDLPEQAERLSIYMASAKRRNVFEPFVAVAAQNVAEAGVDSRKAVQMTQNLKLVGISWLETVDSASVMLEDTQRNVTHVLQRGEKLGDVVVKTIYADSVELGYDDEEIIIRYDKSQM